MEKEEAQQRAKLKNLNKAIVASVQSIDEELAELDEEEKELDSQLSSFPSLEKPLKLTNCLEIFANDSLIKTLVGGTKSKASLITQLAPKLANLALNYESEYVTQIYAENKAKRE